MSATPILRGARWPAHNNRKIHEDALHELALEQACKGICDRCGEVFEGTFRAEREWFTEHAGLCRGLS